MKPGCPKVRKAVSRNEARGVPKCGRPCPGMKPGVSPNAASRVPGVKLWLEVLEKQFLFCRIFLSKKEFYMKWVKQNIGYWCDDIIAGKYLGQWICIAVLDTGIAEHPDLEGRIAGFRDFTEGRRECYDDSGHGTHVAGILAGDGRASAGSYAGMAPCSVLLAGKVLDREGNGDVENVISGIQWLKNVKDQFGVRIVNISVGTQPDLGDAQKQSLLEAVESLWDMGIVVVVSAGNYGPEAGSVAVPGNSRKVITVGVPDSVRPAVYCRREKMNYSGRGPTKECVIKPDVFAPGTGIISCNSRYKQPGEHLYSIKSGTSMAAPVVSGAAACLLSKYPDMTNVEVKLRLRESCVKYPGTEAGWGLLNVKKLMKA